MWGFQQVPVVRNVTLSQLPCVTCQHDLTSDCATTPKHPALCIARC